MLASEAAHRVALAEVGEAAQPRSALVRERLVVQSNGWLEAGLAAIEEHGHTVAVLDRRPGFSSPIRRGTSARSEGLEPPTF